MGSRCQDDIDCGYDDLFTWADKGKYDLPAFVYEILIHTPSPRLDLIALSSGTSAVYYGLATLESRF